MLGQPTEKVKESCERPANRPTPNIQPIFGVASVHGLPFRVMQVGRRMVGHEALKVSLRQCRSQHCQRLEGGTMPHRRAVETGILRQAAEPAERPGRSFEGRLFTYRQLNLRHSAIHRRE